MKCSGIFVALSPFLRPPTHDNFFFRAGTSAPEPTKTWRPLNGYCHRVMTPCQSCVAGGQYFVFELAVFFKSSVTGFAHLYDVSWRAERCRSPHSARLNKFVARKRSQRRALCGTGVCNCFPETSYPVTTVLVRAALFW